MEKEQEITLEKFKTIWGQSDCESGLNLFKQSHASVADNVKANSSDLVITDLNEILQTTNK